MFQLLHPMDRKLLRDLWHMKGQAFAIAIVIACGVGMYVMSSGMLLSLQETRHAYYERYRFADVIAPAKRVPEALLETIQGLPGVRRAESRVRVGAVLDIAGAEAPVTGVLISLPEKRRAIINDIVLRSGRYFDPRHPDEILLLESFARAHGLRNGDHLHAILNGTRKRLTIIGTVLSPEYVYAIGPGEIVPDDRRFGVAWMNRRALAEAYDLHHAFNEALILHSPGGRQQSLIETLDRLLKPYGSPGAYGRDQQVSDQFLSNEIQQLKVMGRLLPPIFLLVAAFLLNMVISRIIDTEREQIGLLKAFGYEPGYVGRHYLKLVLLITFFGILLGMVLGLWLGRGLAVLYMEYFKFPFLIFRAPAEVFFVATTFSLAIAALGTASAVLRVMRLDPAIAMAPPPPPDYSRSTRWIESMAIWMDQPTRMILRHIYRWPQKSALTTLGIAMSMGLLIASSFSLDSVRYMIDVSFNVIERQDVSVHFVEPRNARALHDLRHAPGVMQAEPYRAVRATLRHGTIRRREAIVGLPPAASLSRLVDTRLQPVQIPGQGLVLSDKLAELLQVRVGDLVHVEVTEGRRPVGDLPVSAIVQTYLGTSAYMDLAALNRLMREEAVISGAYLRVDSDQRANLYRALKNTPVVAGIGLQEEAQQAFNQTLQEILGTFTLFNTLFAALIAIGVVYNSARISLSERGRELASLRVLGLSRGEVSYILLGELTLLTLLALPLGALLGHLLARWMVHSFDTELFRIPLIINPATYGYAALVVILAAVASGLLVRRRVDQLDLIAVLKTRE